MRLGINYSEIGIYLKFDFLGFEISAVNCTLIRLIQLICYDLMILWESQVQA
jgi:hypothetical protein